MSSESRHTIIKHEPGCRILAVEEGSGRVVEIVRAAANAGADVVRRENGLPLPHPLFSGSVEEASVVLDAMAAAFGRPPAAVASPAAGPARRGPSRDTLVRRRLLTAAAAVAVVTTMAGMVIYDRATEGVTWHVALRPSNDPVRPFAAYARQEAKDADKATPATNNTTVAFAQGLPTAPTVTPADATPPRPMAEGYSPQAAAEEARQAAQAVSALPTSLAAPGPRPVASAPRPNTPEPHVALPGAPVTAAAMQVATAPAQASASSVRAPLRGEALGLAKIEAAPLTKNLTAPAMPNTYPTPPVAVANGSEIKLPAKVAGVSAPAPSAEEIEAATTVATPKDATPAAATPVPAQSKAPANASTIDHLATKVEAANKQSAEAREAAKKDVGERGPDAVAADKEKLQAVLASLERGDKIPLDVVAKLPIEIAQRLREAGVVLTEEEAAIASKADGSPGYRIVRLPPDAVDRLRDKDGIPTVPQANSWAATGGNVRLPLPGGGEIKSAEDMSRAFHLQP